MRRLVPVASGGSFNRTDDTGGYRITGLEPGDYVVMATTRDAWTDETNPKERIGFLPTYSGGTPNPENAQRLKVGLAVAGERRGDGHDDRVDLRELHVDADPHAESPSSLMARYGSIRGASSFGVSAPKVFIDGIEVSNPLLVTQIAPEAVERIEVIRGPQGAALYGTDAISGVVNIVTRHEGTDSGASAVRVRGSVGLAESEFASGGALAQEVAIALRRGTSVRSAGLDVGFGGMGDFLPDGASRYVLASGSARQVGARSITTYIVRFYDARAGGTVNPLLADALGPSADSVLAASAAREQRMRQYTMGTTIKVAPDDRWTHTLIAGIDGDRLDGVPDERTPVPSPAEGAWRGSAGGADRGTLRLSSVARIAAGEGTELTLTLAAEMSALREEVDPPALPPRHGEDEPVDPIPLVNWSQNTGVVAQASAAVRDRLHLTGGLRIERNEGLVENEYAALPVLGAAPVMTKTWRMSWVSVVPASSFRQRTQCGAPAESL